MSAVEIPLVAPPATPGLSLASVEEKVAVVAKQPGSGELMVELEEEASVVTSTFREKGWKSSEFWLTVLVVILGSVFAGVQLYQGKLDAAGAAAFLGAVVKAATYTAGRAALKRASVESP